MWKFSRILWKFSLNATRCESSDKIYCLITGFIPAHFDQLIAMQAIISNLIGCSWLWFFETMSGSGQFNVDTLGDHKVSLILELILDEKINSFIRIDTELTQWERLC